MEIELPLDDNWDEEQNVIINDDLFIDNTDLIGDDFHRLANVDAKIACRSNLMEYPFRFYLINKQMHHKFGKGLKIDIVQIVNDIEDLKMQVSEITDIDLDLSYLCLREN